MMGKGFSMTCGCFFSLLFLFRASHFLRWKERRNGFPRRFRNTYTADSLDPISCGRKRWIDACEERREGFQRGGVEALRVLERNISFGGLAGQLGR